MKKLAIIGFSGRMGTEIRALAADAGFTVTTGVSSTAGDGAVTKVDDLDANKVDVVIDFSLPELTEDVAAFCARHKKPLVSGVTGLNDKQKQFLANAARETAVLWAPNMSLGIAVLARMLGQLSKLEGFDFQIEELHHNRKKDRPSGTALFLQERLKEAVGNEVPEALAIRGGGVFGIHRVWALGEEEMITLEHTAMNRRVFARGALRAANWILAKKPVLSPGLYKMDDVLS